MESATARVCSVAAASGSHNISLRGGRTWWCAIVSTVTVLSSASVSGLERRLKTSISFPECPTCYCGGRRQIAAASIVELRRINGSVGTGIGGWCATFQAGVWSQSCMSRLSITTLARWRSIKAVDVCERRIQAQSMAKRQRFSEDRWESRKRTVVPGAPAVSPLCGLTPSSWGRPPIERWVASWDARAV